MNQDDTINLDIPLDGIFNTLLTLDDGDLYPDLNDKLRELTRSVRQHRKKGKLTITVTVEMAGDYENVLNVLGTADLVKPKPKPRASLMFSNNQGGLLTDKPEQKGLDFERLSDTDTNVTSLNPPTKDS